MIYKLELDEELIAVCHTLEDTYPIMQNYVAENEIDADEVHFVVTELDESLH